MTAQRKLFWLPVCLLLGLCLANDVSATVEIEWVTVGDPGNAPLMRTQADGTSGYGQVDYEYRMGKYEITNSQYAEFLNAVASTDTNQLYWTLMGGQIWGGITRSGANGNYTYAVKPNFDDKPVNYVTWYDCARFANWLHNGQPVGAQDASTTEDGAYTFIGFETVSPRNPGAKFFIPDEHEWEKAAFYEPGAATSDGDEYWLYSYGGDALPIPAVADANGDVRNPGPNVVNYYHGAGWNGGIEGMVVTVGSSGNTSYYGAADMGGNVFEWTTADPTKPDPFNVGPYIVRGASFQNTFGHLKNIERNLGPGLNGAGHQHSFASKNNGFRLASYLPSPISVPEPAALALFVMGLWGVSGIRRKGLFFALLLAAALIPTCSDRAAADTFGSDSNLFEIDFVTIGNPGNPADASGDPNPDSPGSVAYGYRIGKYEISESMIAKANTIGDLNIGYITRGPDKPVTQVTWLEAITFVNWLNTSTGYPEAYKFNGSNFALWQPADAGYDPTNLYRNSLAKYFLPSADEWYKAAFYDPSTGDYFDYPTGSNSAPVPVASGTLPNTAVYGQVFSTTPPADITQAGGLSPYGTMAQGGNVYELEESDFDMVNDAVSSPRGARGGNWAWGVAYPQFLSKSYRNSVYPNYQTNFLGFRVAAKAKIADFDFDDDVDSDDLEIWNAAYGLTAEGDADGDGDSDGDDFLLWQRVVEVPTTPLTSSLASVPEPSSVVLGSFSMIFAACAGRCIERAPRLGQSQVHRLC